MENIAIKLQEGELVRLIYETETRRGCHVQTLFGPGWVAVEWWKCEWVLPIIAEMRGITK